MFSIDNFQKPELEEIDVSLNVRIEHIVTGTWLHGSRGRKSLLKLIFSLHNLKYARGVSICLKT